MVRGALRCGVAMAWAAMAWAALVLPACGSAGGTAGPATTTAAPTTAAPTTAVPTTAVPTTVPFVPTAFRSPAEAGSALFGAWTRGDRGAAVPLAAPEQLDRLFAAPRRNPQNRGCDDGAFGGRANCFFGNGQGGVSVSLTAAPGGWTIADIQAY